MFERELMEFGMRNSSSWLKQVGRCSGKVKMRFGGGRQLRLKGGRSCQADS